MKTYKFHPIDLAVMKCLSMDLYATSNQVANAINIHSQTARNHLEKLSKLNIVLSQKRGTRNYWKLNERKKITWQM